MAITIAVSHAMVPSTLWLVTPPLVGERSIVMSVSVSVCVYLSVRDPIFGITHPIFTTFLCMLPMAVAQSPLAA